MPFIQTPASSSAALLEPAVPRTAAAANPVATNADRSLFFMGHLPLVIELQFYSRGGADSATEARMLPILAEEKWGLG
ncbi:hypothetical protein DEJ50_14830 [Streptomyces venezuelae]|uniref:Uncharacterized protein n=1 Tax=Streptomyces venezuelae TaxID=54571 RepID=A0A5P2D2D2_STRVZ|nr:hypothetical protein DEJ50_14830 [Streptomyces venezuelae]